MDKKEARRQMILNEIQNADFLFKVDMKQLDNFYLLEKKAITERHKIDINRIRRIYGPEADELIRETRPNARN